ncbi:MAG: tRNA uridine-5-carboxymethylaminomethyl(34) synthesis GTPase MnmE [Desulfobulbales bacterium]|nr:tRNA uridine-5-carboxymethylaminomethyl(34) synthesis GTPase MnmE [Desulfobulbales bacterium]
MTAGQHRHDRDGATIAAIATPPGPGGIGIIRISGPAAGSILSELFIPHRQKPRVSHQLTYGRLVDPASGRPLDEVMAVFMTAPHSYTREDVVEIQCHGSFLVLQEILGLVLKVGAVAAEPGEFTKRAFLNGRIDLTQAEAVIELLQAKTGEGMQLALSQLEGGLHERIVALREALIAIKAVIEVAIDFPDEDVEIIKPRQMLNDLQGQVITPLNDLITAAERGRIFREGISVVILGRPNVGKSSLLNSLLQEDRAIVTEIPGTTRDIIEEYLDIRGIPVRIIDTAGIRQGAEAVEEIGIRKARQKLASADLVLLVVDGAVALTEEDRALAEIIGGQPAILVVNKIDLAPGKDLRPYQTDFPRFAPVAISAKTGQGLARLEAAVFAEVSGGGEPWEPNACVPNVRHAAALAGALAASRQLEGALRENLPPDLLAIEVQAGLDHLGDIIGETTTDDVLEMIFTRFCLGK